MQTRVIVGSRARAALLGVGGVVLTLLSAWVLTQPDASLKVQIAGWIGAPFFAFATLAAIALVFKPTRLTLSASGFEVRAPLAKTVRRVAWGEIEPLFLWRVRSSRVVAYRFRPGRRPLGWLAGVNAALGFDGALPASLPMKPQDLADLMNAYRAAAVDGAPTP